MRRMMFLMVALCTMMSMVGCKISHSHGVCDCQHDDHCSSRSPWVRVGTGPISTGEAISVPPTRLPEVKTGLE